MRLHHFLAASFLVAVVAMGAGSARAEVAASKDLASKDLIDGPKRLETVPGATTGRGPAKLSALFSTQGQLFVEQKDAPTASKTSLRLDGAPKLSSKSKD